MNPLKALRPWIPLDRLEPFLQLEPALVLGGLILTSWLFYRFFLKRLAQDRHQFLKELFKNLFFHSALAGIFFVTYTLLSETLPESRMLSRVLTYLGILAMGFAGLAFVKTCRLLLLEYLFLSHMRAGVPMLLVNIFTLLIYIVVGGWLLNVIFHISLTPLLATSAIVSIVLGLALQETLGNLFAGISLQFDKPYELGDWIEVSNGSVKRVGRVSEISWRATTLIGLTDEIIVLPNRVMAQSEICNFSGRVRPFSRGITLRLPHTVDITLAKSLLIKAADHPKVLKNPAPGAVVIECAESWIALRLAYYLDDYIAQYAVADAVTTAAIGLFRSHGIQPANPRVTITPSWLAG